MMFRLFNIRIAQRFDYAMTAAISDGGTNSHNRTETLAEADDGKTLSFYGATQQTQWTIALKHTDKQLPADAQRTDIQAKRQRLPLRGH